MADEPEVAAVVDEGGDPEDGLRAGLLAGRRLVTGAALAIVGFLCVLVVLGFVGERRDGAGTRPRRLVPPTSWRDLGATQAAGAGGLRRTGAPRPRGGAPAGRVQPASQRGLLPAETRFSAEASRKRRAYFATAPDERGFERLPEPRPGEWLWQFREHGQTLAEYLRADVNRRNAVRRTLHVQPFGDLTPRQRSVLAAVRDHTAAFFDTPVAVLPERRLPPIWYHYGRGQWDADLGVRSLASRVPRDSLGLLGLMGSDLYSDGLNFVFGLGLMRRRAALCSLHRYETGDQRALLRRALKVAVHELGHVLTLGHCVFYRCVMNGSNSVEELDGQPLHVCPVCLAKLRANLRFDPRRRYARLAAVYRRLGLDAAAAFARARAAERPLSAASP